MSNNREATKGITRINIIGSNFKRAREARAMWSTADVLYRKIFQGYLMPGAETVNCTLDEFKAGYDKDLGIDVFLTFVNGMTLTMQEKFLTTAYSTVTVEYQNVPKSNTPGDWCELKAQFYFVGYYDKKSPVATFTRWVMLDWPMVVWETQKGNVPWKGPFDNSRTRAQANFKYIEFAKVPKSCIVAKDF